MKQETVKKILITSVRLLFFITRSLFIFVLAIIAGSHRKWREPTSQEIVCGERLPGSDKYFFPDDKK